MASNVRDRAKSRREFADNRPIAHARYIRISSRKVKIVIDLIRGKQVDDALAILQFTPKAASPVVSKLLSSAIANAENNEKYGMLSREKLYVDEIYANQGPTLKRMRAGSRGMGKQILKRTSHITVILDEA